MRSARSACLAASLGLLAAATTSSARAQIVLPGQKAPETKDKPGNLAPHLVCKVCGERNYNLHDDGRRDDQGLVIAWCSHCKRDTSQLPSSSGNGSTGNGTTPGGKASGKGGRLVLPTELPPTSPSPTPIASGSGDAGRAVGKAPVASFAPRGATPPGSARASAGGKITGQAAFILGEVRRLKRVDDSLVIRASESLLALGEDGIAAARESLSAEDAPVLLTGARVLLRTGSPEDADLVQRRMREPLPAAAGVPLLELLLKADPIRASPTFLAEMLEHPHMGVRAAAQKHLSTSAKADLLPLLASALASRRADTRRSAVEVVAGIDGPEATETLLEHVDDSSASVAEAAVRGLSAREDPEVRADPESNPPVGPDSHADTQSDSHPDSRPESHIDAKLVGLAFKDRWILRPGACALIAIVEREDRNLRPILDDTRTEPLLLGLQSSDPFLSGACAAALAGIGFRSRDTRGTTWLDQDVVDRLVAAVSGHQFHSDLPLLQGPAVRRLELLAGQGIGTDGPRWVEWWLHARDGFFARRAWLDVSPEDASRISVRYAQTASEAQDFTLVGPEGDAPAFQHGEATGQRSGATEVIRLTADQARDLAEALKREGVFGPERLPGVRGLRGSGERTLEIALGVGAGVTRGARGKTFVFGPGESDPWFDRTAALARELLDRGRWQRYSDPTRPTASLDLWKEQSSWWAVEHTSLERALRMKQLVLTALPSLAGARREQAISEMERLYGPEHAAEPQDFPPLFRALSAETYWAETARRLLNLTLLSARASATPGTNGTPGASGTPGAPGAAETSAAPGTIGTEAASTSEPPRGDGPSGRELSAEQGRLLIDVLVEKLSTAPPQELAHVFAGCGAGFTSLMAGDSRPAVRAAAAHALAEPSALDGSGSGAPQNRDSRAPPSQETVATLLRLLGDRDESVEVAAVQALGELRVEAARTELLVRARLGLSEVRAAALRAIGRLGGDFVLDALFLGAADSDANVRTAAVCGLADLRDPSSATILIGMLGQGEGAPTTEPARAGLLAMGPAAWTELLRVVHSPTHRARRDAALLLARQGVPEAASPMMAMLSSDSKDEHLASELAVLTGVDLRSQPDPASAWWAWWDGVVHDDSLSWFLSALSRGGTSGQGGAGGAGATPPAQEAFSGAGTREARLFLVDVLSRREPHLVERARRELSRMLSRDLGPLPLRGAERGAWIERLRATVETDDSK